MKFVLYIRKDFFSETSIFSLHLCIFFGLGKTAPCLPKAMTMQIRTQNPTAVHVGLHIA